MVTDDTTNKVVNLQLTYPLFKYTGNATGLPVLGTGAPAGLTTTIEKDESDPLNKQVVVKIAPPTLYWAPTATDCNISTQWGGGSGTWNTLASNQVWCAQGNAARVGWQQGAKAVFPRLAASVSVADAIQFESLEFQVAGYSLNLGAGGRLTGTSTGSTVTAITTSHAVGTTTTIAAPLDGNLPHTKEGTGTLMLTGSNTFGGSIAVNGGTLQLGNSSGTNLLSSTTEVKLSGGGVLALNLANNATFNNKISGAGAVNKIDSGTLNLGGVSDYSGVTTVSAGTLKITHANALGAGGSGNGTVVDGTTTGTLHLLVDVAEPITLQNNGKLLTDSGSRTLSGALSMGTAGGTVDVTGTELLVTGNMGTGSTALNKIGAGNLVLSGVNSAHTGPINVNAGKLIAANNAALSCLDITVWSWVIGLDRSRRLSDRGVVRAAEEVGVVGVGVACKADQMMLVHHLPAEVFAARLGTSCGFFGSSRFALASNDGFSPVGRVAWLPPEGSPGGCPSRIWT